MITPFDGSQPRRIHRPRPLPKDTINGVLTQREQERRNGGTVAWALTRPGPEALRILKTIRTFKLSNIGSSAGSSTDWVPRPLASRGPWVPDPRVPGPWVPGSLLGFRVWFGEVPGPLGPGTGPWPARDRGPWPAKGLGTLMSPLMSPLMTLNPKP